jgi:caa(3)-type oxidase subunit IV
MSRESEKFSARAPLLVWAALLAGLAASAAYALWPAAPGKIVAGLGIGVIKVVLIGLFFMRLNKATPLIRLTAGAGARWLGLLFVFLFSDYLTRPS